MAIQFLTDSASDILPGEPGFAGLTILPMQVLFGEQVYLDGPGLSHEGFFEKLIETDIFPTTCQITPAQYAEAFQRAIDAGDEVVAITLSGKLSGTYQSACVAAQDFPGKVYVVDSENATVGQRILVQRGLALRDMGLSAGKIALMLDEEKHKIRLLALLDTLEYLKKGGRISAATALAGSLLSIKPVVGVVDGAVTMIGKARGSRHGGNLLRELIAKTGGIRFDLPYCLAYSGLSDALLHKYIADSAELWEGHADDLPIATVGCAIGAHVGPGAIAVAFFEP